MNKINFRNSKISIKMAKFHDLVKIMQESIDEKSFSVYTSIHRRFWRILHYDSVQRFE